jgi:hypothetical protein
MGQRSTTSAFPTQVLHRSIQSVGGLPRLLIFSLLALFGLAACDHITPPDGSEPSAIALYPATALVEEGDLVQLQVTDATTSGSQAASGVSVDWQTSDPGVATVARGMVRGVNPGEARITAITQSGKVAEATVKVGRTPAQIVLVNTADQEAEVGYSLDAPLEAKVLSARGRPVPGAEIRFRVVKGAGSTSPVIVEADEDGIVRSEWRLGPVAGEQVVQIEAVSHNGTRAAVQAEARPGAPDRISISPSEVSLRLGAPFQFAAQVTDRYGNKLGSIPVRWSSSNPDVVRVNVEGWVTGVAPGTAVVEALPATGELSAASAALMQQVAASPGRGNGNGQAKVTVSDSTDGDSEDGSDALVSVTSGDDQVGVVGTTLGQELGIRVTDADGNPIRQFDVTWQVVEGDGSVSEATTRTNGQGRTAVDWTLGPVPGAQKVEAQAGNLGSVTFRAEALVGPVETVTVSPGSGRIEVDAEMDFSAAAQDRYGNPIPGGLDVTWSVIDQAKATVSAQGRAKGLATGNTQVVASVEGVKGSAELTVDASSVDDGGNDSGDDGSGDDGSDDGDSGSDDSDAGDGSDDGSGDDGSDDGGTGDGGSDGGDGGGDSSDDTGDEVSNPGQVTDLSVASTTERSATLRFTEVDDGTGNPAQYNVRYHLHPIEWGWGQATHVEEGSCADPVQGQSVGSEFTCVAEGLDPDVKYDFQLVAYRMEDGKRVFGTLSNVATGTTAGSDLEGDAVSEVLITQEEVSFSALGDEVTLDATALDEDGGTLSGASIEWTSTDEEVVIVNSSGTLLAKGIGTALVVASAACCEAAAADSVTVQVDQKVAAVEVDPSSVTLEEGNTRQLSAVALDANGFLVADAGFSWSSSDTSVASVSSTGGLKAESHGSANVTARVDGVDGASSVTVQQAGGGSSGGGSADRPNEPSHFTRIAEHDMSSVADGAIAGAWSSGSFINPTEVKNAGVPLSSSPDALRVSWGEGWRAGTGSWAALGWSEKGWGPTDDPREEMYMAVWVRVGGERFDFESQPATTKLWYNSSANSSTHNQHYIGFVPGGIRSEFQVRWWIGQIGTDPNASNYGEYRGAAMQRSANVDSRHLLKAGEWVLIEIWGKMNTVDAETKTQLADGEGKIWVNGALTWHYDDIMWRGWKDNLGWYRFHGHPIWGGSGDPKTRADDIDFGHVYVSSPDS